jgi:hypothetical protein
VTHTEHCREHLCLAHTLFPRLQLGLYMLVLNTFSVLNIRQYDKFLHSQMCGNTYKNCHCSFSRSLCPSCCLFTLHVWSAFLLTCLESVGSVWMLFYVHVWSVSGVLFASISRLCLHCLDFSLLAVNSKHHLFQRSIFFKSRPVPRNFDCSISCNISRNFFQVWIHLRLRNNLPKSSLRNSLLLGAQS